MPDCADQERCGYSCRTLCMIMMHPDPAVDMQVAAAEAAGMKDAVFSAHSMCSHTPLARQVSMRIAYQMLLCMDSSNQIRLRL